DAEIACRDIFGEEPPHRRTERHGRQHAERHSPRNLVGTLERARRRHRADEDPEPIRRVGGNGIEPHHHQNRQRHRRARRRHGVEEPADEPGKTLRERASPARATRHRACVSVAQWARDRFAEGLALHSAGLAPGRCAVVTSSGKLSPNVSGRAKETVYTLNRKWMTSPSWNT